MTGARVWKSKEKPIGISKAKENVLRRFQRRKFQGRVFKYYLVNPTWIVELPVLWVLANAILVSGWQCSSLSFRFITSLLLTYKFLFSYLIKSHPKRKIVTRMNLRTQAFVSAIFNCSCILLLTSCRIHLGALVMWYSKHPIKRYKPPIKKTKTSHHQYSPIMKIKNTNYDNLPTIWYYPNKLTWFSIKGDKFTHM